jgi:predicted Rossmann fold nucleotide-binding protein DprA/Smf involved in DNA uptake
MDARSAKGIALTGRQPIARLRLISSDNVAPVAIALGVVVVEAATRSGSLISTG